MINSFGYLLYFHLLCQFGSQQFRVIWNNSPKPQMYPLCPFRLLLRKELSPASKGSSHSICY